MLIWNDVLQIQFEFNIFNERQDAVCGGGGNEKLEFYCHTIMNRA